MAEDTDKLRSKPPLIRVKSVFWLVLLLLYVLAILSYDKGDLAILEGGIDGETEKNWIGPMGAQISRALFYLFGLAVYPMGFIMILSVVRSFFRTPLKRQGYAGALLSVCFGTILLFAMWPERFIAETEALGIGRMIQPSLALSGGVVGAAFSAPPDISVEAGLIRSHIGEIGTLVVALAFLLPGLFVLFMQDWYPLIAASLAARRNPAPKPVSASAAPPPEPSPSTPAPTPAPLFGWFRRLFAAAAVPETESHPENEPITAPAPAPKVTTMADLTASRIADDDEPAVTAPAPLPGRTTAAVVADVPLPPVVEPPAPVEPVLAVSRSSFPAVAAPVIQYAEEKQRYDREKPHADGRQEPPPGTFDCGDFKLPPVALLDKQNEVRGEDTAHIESSRDHLQKTFDSFHVDGHVSEIVVGPRVTRFEVTLEQGVKVEKVTNIQNNIAMDLAAESIRILAPIPGKNTVGIEVPNKVSSTVYIRPLMESPVWKESHFSIPIVLGRDIAGKVIVTDLAKAPHLLIAGSTGSGKSVCMNTLIMSLLFRFSPSELRLIMVDPKVVELEIYRPLPHLITPVVNDPKKVPLALRWGVNEMERRYRVLAKVKAKNLAAFNSRPVDPKPQYDDEGKFIPAKLPLVIIIIDELADIMMTEAKSDVETSICRIAQKGRAAGMHLVIATQSPRKDVITGLIKANLPTKIAFRVGSNMDSRVILDAGGAEKLLGWGDMLFKPNGAAGMERIQGSMVSDPEIQKVVDFVSGQVEQRFDAQVVAEDVEVKNGVPDAVSVDDGEDAEADISHAVSPSAVNSAAAKYLRPGDSDLLRKALEIIINEQKASTSYLQRRLGIGYNKSAELMDQLEDRGIISAPLPGGQKREILICDGLEQNEDDE